MVQRGHELHYRPFSRISFKRCVCFMFAAVCPILCRRLLLPQCLTNCCAIQCCRSEVPLNSGYSLGKVRFYQPVKYFHFSTAMFRCVRVSAVFARVVIFRRFQKVHLSSKFIYEAESYGCCVAICRCLLPNCC